MPTTEELKQTSLNAEKDLNSYQAKQGLGKKSDSSMLDYDIIASLSALTFT